jgi:hypothetical protein
MNDRSGYRLWLLALAACALAGCGSRQQALSDEDAYQRFVGTWVNTDYPGTLRQSQITVIRPDYVGEDWLFPASTSPEGQWTIAVEKTWVDKRGNTYCQFFVEQTKGLVFTGEALMRVDKKKKVLEINSRQSDRSGAATRRLEEIDPTLRNYWIYYRKE